MERCYFKYSILSWKAQHRTEGVGSYFCEKVLNSQFGPKLMLFISWMSNYSLLFLLIPIKYFWKWDLYSNQTLHPFKSQPLWFSGHWLCIFSTVFAGFLFCIFFSCIIYTLIEFFTSSHFWLLAYIWCRFLLCWMLAFHIVLSEIWWSRVLQMKTFVTFASKIYTQGNPAAIHYPF